MNLFDEAQHETAKVGAIAPWYGAKRNMAQTIIQALGPHRAYWELFCGSMAVLLAKPPAPFETVNDLHGDLVNLAKVIQHGTLGPALYRQLRRAPFSQTLFLEIRARCDRAIAVQAPDLQRAYDYFLLSWQGMNGVAGTQRYNLGFARRFTKNGGHAAKRWASTVDSIPTWRRRLRNVTILSADGIELAERIEDADGVVIYVDPPYLEKGARYLHDFNSLDHLRLARNLQRFKRTRVVVSYYAHAALADLYPDWEVREHEQVKALVSQGRRGKDNDTIAPEVLLINRRAA